MSTKLTKQDVRAPDRFQKALTTWLDWAGQNSRLVLGVIAIAVLVGAGMAVARYKASQAQLSYQEKFSVIERQLLDKKQSFEEARRAQENKTETKSALPSGDLSKDYGTLVGEMEALIQQAPWSVAASMAALHVAELKVEYKMPDQALAVLELVNPKNEMRGLPATLIVSMKAGLLADKGDCKTAVGLWEKISRSAQAAFLKNDAKLRMGLCYESMNEIAKAEQLYGEVAAQDDKNPGAGGESSREAERYLRLLKLKKATQGG